MELKKDSVGH